MRAKWATPGAWLSWIPDQVWDLFSLCALEWLHGDYEITFSAAPPGLQGDGNDIRATQCSSVGWHSEGPLAISHCFGKQDLCSYECDISSWHSFNIERVAYATSLTHSPHSSLCLGHGSPQKHFHNHCSFSSDSALSLYIVKALSKPQFSFILR